MKKWLIVSLALGALTGAALASTVPAVTVAQKGREFAPQNISVRMGEVVRFTNEDEYIHQIFVRTSEFAFDSNEQRPGQAVEVPFTKRGSFAVRCGIHPKMSLTVDVK